MTSGELAALAIALGAVFVRGAFAAAESAFLSLGRMQVAKMAEHGLRGARTLLRLKKDAEGTLAALRVAQVGFGAIGAGLAGYLGATALSRRVDWTALGVSDLVGAFGSVALTALIYTVVTYPMGDFFPRAYGATAPEAAARRFALPMAAVRTLLAPPIRLAHLLARTLVRPLGIDTSRIRPVPALEEIESLLATHAARGELDTGAPELIRSVFEFGETTAKEVMVPRTAVVALELSASAGEVLSTLATSGHTRLPVYREEIDEIVGIINAKDIIPLVERGEPIELTRILRPPTIIPWSKPIPEVMRELKSKHVHMAVVVDEFGGFMGIITMEDILEELVGEIEDEFDRPEGKDVESLQDGSFLVRGSMEIEAFNETFSASLPEDEDYETLAGFLNALAGAIPQVGDTFFYDGLQLTVTKRNERRVRQVQVRRIRPLAVVGETSS